MSPRASRSASTLALVGLLGACSLLPRGRPEYEARPGPYDRLDSVGQPELAEVRRLRDAGELETARAYVGKLSAREPDNLPLARLHQDLALELGGEPARVELAWRARARLDEHPDVPALLLAARLETEAAARRRWLDRALEREPESAWVHYALAYHEALVDRWSLSAQRLERALLIDPGHLWARRLETMLLARGGDRDEAVAALERWVKSARASPFFSTHELDQARLDLAQLLLLGGQARSARDVLEEVSLRPGANARLHLLLAAVEQDQERPRLALASAWQAEEDAPGEALPLVQQAMLHEEWLADPAAARAAWQRVLDVAGGHSDLGTLLLVLRARAALARLGPVEEQAPVP